MATRVITEDLLSAALQRKFLHYDKSGEEHYNIISALHKSVRNSDADATLYWLARMLESGENPLYLARRLVRMASEDIGLADPAALGIAVAAMQAADFVGVPEGNLALAQAAVYLALAPKSNALYTGYGEVQSDLQKTAAEPVPLHLRNAVTGLMKHQGYGRGYQYAHNIQKKWRTWTCLPESLAGRRYYKPADQGLEQRLRQRMEEIRKTKSRHASDERKRTTSATTSKQPERFFAALRMTAKLHAAGGCVPSGCRIHHDQEAGFAGAAAACSSSTPSCIQMARAPTRWRRPPSRRQIPICEKCPRCPSFSAHLPAGRKLFPPGLPSRWD